MHEISLVRNIFRTLKEVVPPENREKLSAINLKIGLLSNVEPVLMENAFAAVVATENPEYHGVKLFIETVPVEVYCHECNRQTRVENYHFVCACGKPNNNIVQGAELLISSIEFND